MANEFDKISKRLGKKMYNRFEGRSNSYSESRDPIYREPRYNRREPRYSFRPGFEKDMGMALLLGGLTFLIILFWRVAIAIGVLLIIYFIIKKII